MKEFIEYITKHLVDDPDRVEVTEHTENNETVYAVKVADADIGKMIGKKGKTAYALRILTMAAGKKQGVKAIFKLIEKPKPQNSGEGPVIH